MAIDSRSNKIITLRLKIKEAKNKIPAAKELMVKNKYSLISIKEYNKKVSDVLILKEQLEYVMKYNKPKQYMDEVIVPNKYLY